MQTACCYLRRSKDDPQQVSIGRPTEECLAAAEASKYQIPEHYIFVDEGISGAILERPGLEELMTHVRSGQVQAVFIADDDRLSRGPGHLWLPSEEFKLDGVTLYVKDRPSDLTPEGQIKSGLLALFAKYERVKTAERMRLGKLHRARQGKPMSGFRPLGYRYCSDTPAAPAHWELVEEEAALIRRIFDICLSVMGIWAIARQLTRERVPTKMDQSISYRREKSRAVGVRAP